MSFPKIRCEAAEQLLQAGRPVDLERDLTAPKRERLQHPRQAEVVVGVVVGEEDLGQLDQADRRAQELALRPFAAVDEETLAAPADERGRESPPAGRDRAGRAQKDEVEIHRASVGSAARPGSPAPETAPATRRT